MPRDDAKYPERPKFFASNFHQLMLADDLINRYGCNGKNLYVLLSMVVTTKDRLHYSGAVGLWNEQLAKMMGVSVSTLWRLRGRAVKDGWLHYEAGKKGVEAQYWVTIPGRA